MANINISIKEEAYQYLKMLKGRDKSFSDVIIEMKGNCSSRKGSKDNVLRFAGVLKDANVDWDAAEKRMKNFRKSFSNRVEETRKKMREK
jgi:predicted CopG family antitoxin